VSYLGPTTEYSVRIDGGPIVLVHQQNESASGSSNLTVGRPIALGLAPENCMVFSEPRTGA
jgi:hypothetical protein